MLRAAEGKYSAAYRKLADSYNNSTQINKQTASEMISEVVALQNKENPRQQTASTSSGSRSQSSSNSGTITAEDFMRHSDVGRPSYGSIPTNVEIYMKSSWETATVSH